MAPVRVVSRDESLSVIAGYVFLMETRRALRYLYFCMMSFDQVFVGQLNSTGK